MAELKEGCLIFENRVYFNNTIRNLKKIPEEIMIQEFRKFYEKGFVPAFPHFADYSEEKMASYLIKKKEYIPRIFADRELEKADMLVSSNELASLLNIKREVIIADTLYKFTYSGLLFTHVKNKSKLKDYVISNDLYDVVPNPLTLPGGVSDTEEEGVLLYVNPRVSNPENNNPPCGDIATGTNDSFVYPAPDNPINPLLDQDYPCYNVSIGGGNYSEDEKHTASLINYIKTLEPCNVGEQWNPFGVTKKCTEEFPGGKRRTKTIYAYEDYFVYKDIRVKTIHQRKHKFLFAEWWAGKKTDEVALLIKDITLKITPPKMEVPNPYFNVPPEAANRMVFYGDGKILSANSNQSFQVNSDKYPQTPFNEDIIVELYNDNISWGTLTNEKVNKIFWEQVYSVAKDVSNATLYKDPKTMTMLLITPEGTCVHYTNLMQRKTNTKKIKDILAYDWGFTIKFSLPLDGSNSILTNPIDIMNLISSPKVEPGKLADFETVRMNVVGVSRVGDTWAGTNMSYGAQ